jgi:uncharacterized iron-regulated membrane protein
MPFNPRVFFRKAHRWGAVLIAAPFLLVLVTGCLLQLKKEIAWVQPPTKRGAGKEPTASFDAILAAVKTVPEAGVKGWGDVERIDVRPKDGIVKVQCRNRYEVQVDFQTAKVVQVEYRRSDLIESLHDGSFFHDAAKVYVFLPVAVVVLMLWATGMYLFVLPLWVKWKRKPPGGRPPSPPPPPRSPFSPIALEGRDAGS